VNPRTADFNIQRRSFQFACRVVRFCESTSSRGAAGRAFASQLLRAGTGVGSNLEEAVGGQSRADFVSKCNIALKEAREALYWLRLIREALGIESDEVKQLEDEANQLVAILTVIVKRARAGLYDRPS
jgi:four helix bundle protein